MCYDIPKGGVNIIFNIKKWFGTGRFITRIYGTMVIIVVILMVVFTTSVLYITRKNILERELKYNNVILNKISEYVMDKREMTESILLDIYDDYYSNNSVLSFFEDEFETDSNTYYDHKRNFDNYMMSLFGNDNALTDITVYREKYKSYDYYSRSFQTIASAYTYPTSVETASNGISFMPAEFRFQKDRRTYTICMPINSILTGKNVGRLYFEFDTNDITSYIDDYDLLGEVFILTKEQEILYDSTGQYDFEAVSQQLNRNKKDVVESQDMLLVAEINEDILFQKYFYIQTLIITLGIGSFLLSLVLLISFLKRFSRKIGRMTRAIDEIKAGNMEVQLPVTADNDELDDISTAVNDMMIQLNEYTNKYYISEIYKNRALLSALEAQINPHFLNNTLEAIRMKAVSEGNTQVAEMIYILSRLFRSSIKGESVIAIESELRDCELYLKLYQIRYPDKLCVIFDVQENIRALAIPKNILQPVIENYIMHGFRKDRDDNVLKIRMREQSGFVRILIVDNGCGIKQEELCRIRKKMQEDKIQKNNIGLANISGRLRYLYGKGAKLKIKSVVGTGTAVLIAFPNKELDTFD